MKSHANTNRYVFFRKLLAKSPFELPYFLFRPCPSSRGELHIRKILTRRNLTIKHMRKPSESKKNWWKKRKMLRLSWWVNGLCRNSSAGGGGHGNIPQLEFERRQAFSLVCERTVKFNAQHVCNYILRIRRLLELNERVFYGRGLLNHREWIMRWGN